MKILFIIPGAGDSFYCGNCLRDNLYASALHDAGHKVVVMPLYLPLSNNLSATKSPLFFPATTYYVAHKFFKNRKVPKWIERIMGSRFMLDFAASKSGTTSPKGLESMTLSMITGDDAAFQTEIKQLIDWINADEKPDIIHLSSSLLIGIARMLRPELQIPIVCSLQDEEVWIDDMDAHYAGMAWSSINDHIQHVDGLISTSQYYKSIAQNKITSSHTIEVVYPGFDEKKYADARQPHDPVIGFFYRMNEKNGLGILVDAFLKLKRKNVIPNLKLKIGGGFNGQDKSFLKKMKRKLAPFIQDVEIDMSYSPGEHDQFYKSISVISVPITFEEGIGLYLCEAFAAGVPAVVPATGSIPEIVDEAGVLYHPNNSDALAEALEKLLTNSEHHTELIKKAKSMAQDRYSASVMVSRLQKIYENYIIKQ